MFVYAHTYICMYLFMFLYRCFARIDKVIKIFFELAHQHQLLDHIIITPQDFIIVVDRFCMTNQSRTTQ